MSSDPLMTIVIIFLVVPLIIFMLAAIIAILPILVGNISKTIDIIRNRKGKP